MTTPYIDEAERCSRVAFMHKGEIISLDSPSRIKDSLGEEVMEILTDNIRETYRILKEETEFEFQMFGDRINAIVNKVQSDCHEIQNILENNGIEIISCREISPSLENIFIHLIKNYKEASNEAY
jgi:ABC-2 type transport system ATP-binding protein